MRNGVLAASLIATALTWGSLARADDFTFSFSGDPALGAGLVTGEVFGLMNNATSAASRVTVATNTAGYAVPITYQGDDPFTFTNSFTETAGKITEANFSSLEFSSFTDLQLNFEGSNSLDGLGAETANDAGLNGITFAPAATVSAAPEPGTWALMMLGVGFIGWALRYRRRGATGSAALS